MANFGENAAVNLGPTPETAAIKTPEQRPLRLVESEEQESPEEKSRDEMLARDQRVDAYLEQLSTEESGDLYTRVQKLEQINALKNGEVVNRRGLSAESGEKAGVNQVNRLEFKTEKGETVVGYEKQERGNALIDQEGYVLQWNEATGKHERTESNERAGSLAEAISVWTKPEFFNAYAKQMVDMYKIPEADQEAFIQNLKPENFNARLDVDAGKTAIRERAAYVFNRIFKMNNVPPTVLRPVKDEKGNVVDVESVQQEVRSSNESAFKRQVGFDELRTFLLSPEEEWAKELNTFPGVAERIKTSMVDAACFQWAIGSLDGHHENMILTDEGVQLIDNGLSFGKARGVRVIDGESKDLDGNVTKIDTTENSRMLRSVPMEIMSQHPDWKLNDESRQNMQSVYEEVLKNGPMTKTFESMFISMFDDKRIAKEQMKQFLLRIKHLADNGRPNDEKVFQIGTMAMMSGGL